MARPTKLTTGHRGTGSVIRSRSGMEPSLPRGSSLVVVEGGNGRLDAVAAMPKQPVASDPVLRAHRDNQACVPVIRKRNRPAITRMNRADSQSPSGVLGVCRKSTDVRRRADHSRFSPLPGF